MEGKEPNLRVVATADRVSVVLKQLRELQGFSQRELARKVGTTASVVCRLENPGYRGYSLETLHRIGAALGVEVAVEFVRKDPPV